MRAWIVVAFVVGCASHAAEPPKTGGSAAKADPPPPPPPSLSTTCSAVADHLGSMLAASKAAPPDKIDLVRQVVARRCSQDNWTAAAQNCLANIQNFGEGDKCEQMLTDDQRRALDKDGEATVGDLDQDNDAHGEKPAPPEQPAPAALAPPAQNDAAPTKAKAHKATRGARAKGASKTGDPCEGGE